MNLHSVKDDGKLSGLTLGAFRRGKYTTWVPGATIDVWRKCARMENVTGVPWPHAMFIQTIGDQTTYQGIFCPQCRVEVADLRARGLLPSSQTTTGKKTQSSQLSLF